MVGNTSSALFGLHVIFHTIFNKPIFCAPRLTILASCTTILLIVQLIIVFTIVLKRCKEIIVITSILIFAVKYMSPVIFWIVVKFRTTFSYQNLISLIKLNDMQYIITSVLTLSTFIISNFRIFLQR